MRDRDQVPESEPAYIGVLAERVRHMGESIDETKDALRRVESRQVSKDEFEKLWDMVESIDLKIGTSTVPFSTVKALEDKNADHEQRIRRLERAMYLLVGAYALASIGIKVLDFITKLK